MKRSTKRGLLALAPVLAVVAVSFVLLYFSGVGLMWVAYGIFPVLGFACVVFVMFGADDAEDSPPK